MDADMKNKKLYLGLGMVILVIGIAAFFAGSLFNAGVGTVGLGGALGGRVSISLNDITPAPELPSTQADVTGLFVERNDNAIIVQVYSFTGIGGVGGDTTDSGIRTEIVVSSQTKIYKDVTQLPPPVNGEIHNVQQAAEEGTLEDLSSESFLSVWGRSSGDRVIADVLFYSNPSSIKKSVQP
jgi:hypothetical protein